MISNDKLLVNPEKKIKLKDFDPEFDEGLDKDTLKERIEENVEKISDWQEMFYADGRFSLLIVFQAMDAAGKDGVIRKVFSGINPQGCRIHSFRGPSKEESAHDYLWRHYKVLPEKGMFEVFNRSHYENVIVTKVHPNYILGSHLPGIDSVDKITDKFWKERYEQINNFEKHLAQNGTVILKFFLNISRKEQAKRFMERLSHPDKYWKFNSDDLDESDLWDKYQIAYEEMLGNTSTEFAPWYVIPANNKDYTRAAVSEIIKDKLKTLELKFPEGEGKEQLDAARKRLEKHQ
jgi:PPK2 family polyphosphate:nucleotide phosphotransferase